MTSRVTLDLLVETLRDGATEASPWYLTHRQRWRWLIETLLGHPRLRGGQRPRDYPADAASLRAVSVAVQIHRLSLQGWSGMPRGSDCQYGSWLVVFSLMVEGCVMKACPNPEAAALSSLQWAVWQLLRSLNAVEDDAAFHQVIATLGLTRQEFEALGRKPPKSCPGCDATCADSVAIAARAALIAARKADEEMLSDWACADGAGALRDRESDTALAVERMLSRPVWLLRLKTYKVQDLLRRSKPLWMARGASAWVSQALAMARELLPIQEAFELDDYCSRPLLVTDVDALAIFACYSPPPCESLERQLESSLQRDFNRQNPKLANFRMAHPALVAMDLDVLASYPKIRIWSEPMTIRDLCVPRREMDKKALEEERRTAALTDRYCESISLGLEQASSTCSFVNNDRGLIAVGEVPWLRGEKDKEIGWCGIVWSLAGPTYRAHTLQGLASWLDLQPLQLPTDHHDWRRLLGEVDGGIAYLKLDGDRVGRTLGKLPYIKAIQAGLDLQETIQQGLLAGIDAVCDSIKDGGQVPKTLPVDLIYLGGDDLLLSLPVRHLGVFLEGFQTSERSSGKWSFTGIAISVPAIGPPQGRLVPETVARLIPDALSWAKASVRDESTDDLLAGLRMVANESGFSLEVRIEALRSEVGLTVLELKLEPQCH